ARLRGSRDPHAARRTRRPRDDAPDRPLLDRARRLHRRPLRGGMVRNALSRRSDRPRRLVPVARSAVAARDDPRAGLDALPLLAALPRAALLRRRRRPARDVIDPELERKNVVLGLWLF